ncbi:hypothetical protein [Caulobacter sp. 17J80-11]|uniref:hypothetical protein n=1 Tax=Caulobacter sp. 17J80-11 TaxID=2763502 RepID=UPI001653BC22|nr:hypothetical protein [Caulobacter sp. 17J80-11]MBC6982100.1 hypothetical protein [Caulobacter sp. 17J80-11]
MIALVLKRPLTAALALLAALSLAAAGVQGLRVRYAAQRAVAAETAAREATRRAELNAAAVEALDRAHETTRRLEETADDAARTLARDPRGDARLDPGLLADWRDALERLRADAAAARADRRAAEPARAVPEA